jgi:hypothetical protein
MLKRIRKLLDRRKKPAEEVSVAEQAAERPPDRPEPAPSAAAERTRDRPNPPIHEGPRIVHRPIASADLDAEAVKIVRRLTRFDHQAYLVGGCVRDLLLERKPKDFDVGTSATPRQIKRLFRNCRVIGRRFRLAHIYFQDGKIIEVATFRARDGYDESGDEAVKDDLLIRDDNVFGTPEEDALRRDFTINALFYDVNDQTVLDHTDGLTDLRRRLVRTIGDPAIRFREDPIRVLRAIKFAARLDFEIEAATLAAISSTRGEIRRAASPRVLEEINRLCRGGAARRSFELLRSTGVLEVILPEVAAHARGRSWELLLALLERMDARTASAAGRARSPRGCRVVRRGPGRRAAAGARVGRGCLGVPRRTRGRLRGPHAARPPPGTARRPATATARRGSGGGRSAPVGGRSRTRRSASSSPPRETGGGEAAPAHLVRRLLLRSPPDRPGGGLASPT